MPHQSRSLSAIPPPGGWPDPFTDAAVWPEIWRSQPALVFPARPDHPTDSGWTPAEALLALDRAPRWHAAIDDTCLQVTGPDGRPWYSGLVLATRSWRRSARARGSLLLITGPFTRAAELPGAAHRGHLLCAVADVRLSNCF